MMQVLMNTGACKKAIEHGDRGVRRWQMIEADESWARRDHQQQRWLLLAGFGHVPAGRPAGLFINGPNRAEKNNHAQYCWYHLPSGAQINTEST